MQRIVIVDHGAGNLRSVARALDHVAGRNARVCISSAAADIAAADRLVFPGQGAIGPCLKGVAARGLREPLLTAMQRRPFLGICLGLQALAARSEEDGGTAALNLIGGVVKRFPEADASGRRCKVPQMGWNQVELRRAHPLFAGIPDETHFYFVHSYYLEVRDATPEIALTQYAVRFVSAAGRDNLFATQFHPEKSHRHGLRLLENFTTWDGTDT